MTALEFRLKRVEEDGIRLITTAELSVAVDDLVIWPARGHEHASLEIQIDDLLSHLVENWKPLLLRQTYPLTLNPVRPAYLRADAQKRWADLPECQVLEEDELLERFQEVHDLSHSFAGYFDLPRLWFLRSGGQMIIDTDEEMHRVAFLEALQALCAVGDEISELLGSTRDKRWEGLLHAWQRRDEGEGLSLLAWATSLDHDTVERLAADGLLETPRDVTEAANDNDELRIAARMASALPAEQVAAIIRRVRVFPKKEAPELTALSALVRRHLEEAVHCRPFEQGERMATLVRGFLQLSKFEEVPIFDIVRRLGAELNSEDVMPNTLDALAVWGSRHGPAVLLNKLSQRHAGTPDLERSGQVRATLAHELCHLLADSEHALSAVEVLNSRMPVQIEQRARAFAAEFLLPSRVAAELWVEEHTPRNRDGLERVLTRLCRDFTVTRSLAAWKLEHGARLQDVHLAPMLSTIVPQR